MIGGWLTARCLFFLNVLTGSVGTPGGTSPNAWDKWVPRPPYLPPHPKQWNELTWPREYPLAFFEMSFLLPHFLLEGRGALDVYFSRVYNPVWTNPDGMTWVEALTREDLVGRHAALTPVWNETAWYADYVLPVGLGGERHDLHSYETHAGTLDRVPPAGDPRRRRARRPAGHRHPRDQPGRGLGGERVLDRALVADRPRRLARDPALVRGAGPPGREDDRRRLLRLDLRALGPGSPRGGRRGRA